MTNAPITITFDMDRLGRVTVHPAPGETVTVFAHPEGGLTVEEKVVFCDETGPKSAEATTRTTSAFGTNSRDGDVQYRFMRREFV